MNPTLLAHQPIAPGPLAGAAGLRTLVAWSAVVGLLATGSSVTGLLFPAVYPSSQWRAAFLGNDLITLLVAVPVLLLAMAFAARGSARAQLVWNGALYYMMYNYAFYVFGLPVSRLYLPLIAAFALSGFALALNLGGLDLEEIARRFDSRTPARWIAGFLFYVGASVGFLWMSQWIRFLVKGTVPAVNGDADAYRVIAAVDLSFMVTVLVPAAYWLWRRRPWGFILAAMLNVQGARYTAVMAAGCVVGWLSAPGSRLFSAWFIQCLIGCTASLLCLAGLLLNIDRTARTEAAHG